MQLQVITIGDLCSYSTEGLALHFTTKRVEVSLELFYLTMSQAKHKPFLSCHKWMLWVKYWLRNVRCRYVEYENTVRHVEKCDPF